MKALTAQSSTIHCEDCYAITNQSANQISIEGFILMVNKHTQYISVVMCKKISLLEVASSILLLLPSKVKFLLAKNLFKFFSY